MLGRAALRIATVRALRGHIGVGDRVFDSDHGPIDDRIKDETMPVVSVYTDDVKGSGDEGDLLAGGTLKLSIEISITSRMKVQFPEGEGVQWDMPQTDPGMEIAIDAIERKIKVALNNPKNAWGELWHKLGVRVIDDGSLRGTAMREGIRFAGRQVSLHIDMIKDPVPGAAPGPVWQRFLELVDEAPDMAPLAPLLHSLVTGDDLGIEGADVLRLAYGLTEDVARALQILPPAGVDNGATFTGIPTQVDVDPEAAGA